MVVIDDYTNRFFPDNEQRIVADILYNYEFRFSDENMDKVAHIILKELDRRQILLLIDNVQDFDDATAGFINNMLNLTPNFAALHLALSFNTDCLSLNEMAVALYDRLLALCKDDKLHYFNIPLRGFKPGTAKLFIRHCFTENVSLKNIIDNEHNDALNKIAEAGQGNPLFLEQLLHHLCEMDILRSFEDGFYIHDNYSLPAALAVLPSDTEKIIENRWKIIRTRATSARRKEMEKILRFLVFFSELQASFTDYFDLDEECIEFLVQAGFLNKKDSIAFYHPAIANFFSKKYPSLTKTQKAMCAKGLYEYNLISEYEAHYYICALDSSKRTVSLMENAIAYFIEEKTPHKLLRQYGHSLFSAIKMRENAKTFDFSGIIKFFTTYAYKLKRLYALPEALDFYKQVHTNFLKPFPQFMQYGEVYTDFFKEYLNALLTERKTTETIELGTYLLDNIKLMNFESHESRLRAEGIICNRLYIAYNRFERPEKNEIVGGFIKNKSPMPLDLIGIGSDYL